MLTGFNQDVSVNGEIIHVQTEDKGRDKAIVETLVYRGGTIIAAKRTSYTADLEAGTASDDSIGETLKKQHQIIVAIIKAGKVEELVRASQRAAAKAGDEAASVAPVAHAPVVEAAATAAVPPSIAPQVPPVAEPPAPPPQSSIQIPSEPRTPAELDAVGRAVVERLTGPLTGELDLDKIISDYLQSGLQKEKLRLRLLGRADFVAGENVFLQIQATRGTGQPIEGASVVVKVIGTAFKPQIYPGRTDREGVASFSLTLPMFAAGSAAVVVQASSRYGDGEIKHLIRRR
jgi:hypothetical protein